MAYYKIFVPFEPIIFESLTQKHTTKLAETFYLEKVSFTKNEKGEFYTAELEIENQKSREAELNAINRVEEILSLFATWNDGFRVMYSGVKSEKLYTEDQIPSIKKRRNKDIQACVEEQIEIKEHLSTEKTKNNFEFEKNALKFHDKWPDWLVIALKLNYLAVISANLEPSLILRYSAIETITENILGNPESLIKTKFKDKLNERKDFLKDIEEVLKKYRLGNQSVRLIGRIQEAHTESKNERIKKALKNCNIEAKIQNINFVSRQRGKIVHAGKSSSNDDLLKASFLIEEWIRKSLHFILSNQKYYGL